MTGDQEEYIWYAPELGTGLTSQPLAADMFALGNIVYSLYTTVHKTRDPGLASAQAVVLFAIILVLSIAQLRLLERRVHYAN